MPKRVVPLSEQQVRKAKPQAKETKMFDGRGLFLLVTPSGGKLWRFKYQFGGKEKLLAFGSYPEVSLAEAREKLAAARKQVAAGIDPSGTKKALKAAHVAASESLRDRSERMAYSFSEYLDYRSCRHYSKAS